MSHSSLCILIFDNAIFNGGFFGVFSINVMHFLKIGVKYEENNRPIYILNILK